MIRRLLIATLLLAIGAAEAAEPYGKLFFTSHQRATLDAARQQKIRIDIGPEEQEAAPLPEHITVNGIIRRNDGKSTVWVNNRMVSDHAAIPGVTAKPNPKESSRVTLGLPQTGRNVELKVGQSVEAVSGTIEEGYARRPPLPAVKPEADRAPDAQDAEKTASPLSFKTTQSRAGDARRTPDKSRRGKRVDPALESAQESRQ